ncbi:hypothetical protein GGS21DRAFT_525628 [Xylaria nigripes]|nr:hypothetical protein GGS21DRAFT_525628 [Xylaria nigripes]
MAQQGAAGWQMGQVGSDLTGGNSKSHEGDNVGHVDHSTGSYLDGSGNHQYQNLGFAVGTGAYSQPTNPQFTGRTSYSNAAFVAEGASDYGHDDASMGSASYNFQYHPQDHAGHYPEFLQSQPHFGSNSFQQGPWVGQQSSSNPYAQGQHLYSNNEPLLGMPTGPSASAYQVDQVSPFQTHTYGTTYQPSQTTNVRHGQIQLPAGLVPANAAELPATSASHLVPMPSQGQAQGLTNVPTASATRPSIPLTVARTPITDLSLAGSIPNVPEANTFQGNEQATTSVTGTHGREWKSVPGCPYLLLGAAPVRRQVVTNATGIKPHVAGDNRNGTPLLPLIPNPLPCEVLREKVRPLVEELKRVSESMAMTKKQLKGASVGSAEHKKYADELKKLGERKSTLESEKKQSTIKAVAVKAERYRATGKVEAPVYDTESVTESSEEEDPQELLVLQIMAMETRPTDPTKGVQYDVVKIIRQEPSAEQSGTSQSEKEDPWSKVIGQRVANFGKYVVDLCAEAKALKEQKSNSPKSEWPRIQTSLDEKHDVIRIALETALEFGDEETLRNMGQHMKLMGGLTATLFREFQSKVFNTSVQRAVLRFISEATLMDLDTFNRVKLSGTLEKYGDNLDDEGKQLVEQISKNAEERSAKNAAQKPTTQSQPKGKQLENANIGQCMPTQKASANTATKGSTLKPKAAQSGGAAMPETGRKETKNYSGLVSARKLTNSTAKLGAGPPAKRPRDGDAEPRVVKKAAVEGNVTGTGRASQASVPTSATQQSSASNNGTRPRTSGSMVLSKSRMASKPVAKAQEAQSTVSSTIGGLLAEIAKPIEKIKLQEEPAKAPETPEEKARRLRKESRRGRTVTWKPDDELVQVRLFEHDSNEDEGRALSMIKDVRDNRLEGQMLKQMQRSMQGDDDEDDGNPTDIDIRPWVAPSLIDFSVLEQSQREKNYVTRGGFRPIESEQKKVMDAYENRELMAIYTTLSEIPLTPRSPSRMVSEPFVEPKHVFLPANHPKSHEIQLRWAECRQFGPAAATLYATRRLDSLASQAAGSTANFGAGFNVAPSKPTSAPPMTQKERDASVLALLQSDRAKNYVDPDPYDPANPRIVQPPETNDEKVLKAFSIIQSAVDQCKNASASSAALPSGLLPNLTHGQEGYSGYGFSTNTGSTGEGGYPRMAAESTQSQHVAPQTNPFATYQPQAQTQQQSQNYPQATPQVSDQYAAILRQVHALQNPQAAQSTMVPQPAPQANNGLANLLATLSGSAQPVQAAPQDPNLTAWQNWAQSQAQSYGAQPFTAQSFATQPQGQLQGQNHPLYSQQYEGASREEASYGSQKQDYQSQGQYHRDNGERGNRKDFHRGNKEHKGINRALIGTKPCSFWAKGLCAKGDNCTFRHDPNDLK